MISLSIHLLMLLVGSWYIYRIGGVNSSISVSAYEHRTLFLEFCVFLSSLLWIQFSWEIMAYDWGLRTFFPLISAMSFPFIAIYYDFKGKDKLKHYLFAGTSILFALLNVFSVYWYWMLVPVLAAFIAKYNKIFWVEIAAMFVIIFGNLYFDTKYYNYNREAEKEIITSIIEK